VTESIRCPACRGSKKVAKLGGVIGDCNMCRGKGTILAVDKPKPVEPEVNVGVADIISAVADSIPASNIDVLPVGDVIEAVAKIDGKRAVFKKKRA